jgi:hypothetical protein
MAMWRDRVQWCFRVAAAVSVSGVLLAYSSGSWGMVKAKGNVAKVAALLVDNEQGKKRLRWSCSYLVCYELCEVLACETHMYSQKGPAHPRVQLICVVWCSAAVVIRLICWPIHVLNN